ncbi:hypothetical protein FN976_07910 [Caenimonas sedimenti]|uniref:Uncharacterized protein n=1 Tax=Caenimonas sedimenti TaxID=2596921 RepID=A0A562ZU24_9BURK|nr:hypothetical protein [Caenimonas sedimenti]TWO71907.1 hypothetical protein FN976_07910 [Caenimonas sedimenti]
MSARADDALIARDGVLRRLEAGRATARDIAEIGRWSAAGRARAVPSLDASAIFCRAVGAGRRFERDCWIVRALAQSGRDAAYLKDCGGLEEDWREFIERCRYARLREAGLHDIKSAFDEALYRATELNAGEALQERQIAKGARAALDSTHGGLALASWAGASGPAGPLPWPLRN